MRILTHNMVTCLIKNCPQKFPLSINAKKVEVVESEINIEFLKNLLPKLDWNALVSASKDLKIENFPENAPSELEDESTIKLLHNFLVQIQIQEGELLCLGCGRKYPIVNGVPNMLLNENEV